MRLQNRFRPKADAQLLRELRDEAWGAYHDEHFSDAEQIAISEKLAILLEQRFPQADMEVLKRYDLASAPKEVSINAYHPERKRWDVYCGVKLFREVLCPQGRAHFFVGGNGRSGDDHLPAEFEPYFNKIVAARDAYNAESRFNPERTDGSYPTWAEVADVLPVTGPYIHQKGVEASK